MSKAATISLFVIIVCIAAFLRLYLLGSVPAGLTNDEANTGYDAYALLKTGKDQWGQQLPLTFVGFGNYPPPLYRYVTIPFIALFGLNAFALRLPSALFGIGSVILLFFLVRKLWNNQIGLIASFLLAVSPWAIGLNRIALEPNLSLLLILIGLLFFFYSRKNLPKLLMSTFFIMMTIPTYAAYALFAPLIMISLFIFAFVEKWATKKHIVMAAILVLLFLIFFKGNSAGARFSQIGIFGNITSIGLVNTLNDERGACLRYVPSLFCKLENNKIILFSSTLLHNYLAHLSPEFLFLSGTSTQQSILPQRGLDYMLAIFLLFFGMFTMLQGKVQHKIMLAFFFFSIIPDALTSSGNFSRAFIMLPFLQICEAVGAYALFQKVIKIRSPFVTQTILLGCLTISFLGICVFSLTYFTYFRDNYSRFSQFGYEDLMHYVSINHHEYQKVYITTHLNDAKQYIYYLFYNTYNPKSYQKKTNISYHVTSDGWISVDRIENIYFVPSIQKDMVKPGNLLISHPSDFKKCNGIFTIKDRIGYEMFKAIPGESFLACLEKMPDQQL